MLFSSNKPKHHNCNIVAERTQVERIIRISEMIRLLNVSRTTLFRWSKNGTFIVPIVHKTRTIGWAEGNYKNWLKGS